MRKTALLVPALLFTAALAAAADAIPATLPAARVGEWVVVRDVSSPKAGEQTRFRVIEHSGEGENEVVTLRRETLGDDGDPVEIRDIDIRIPRYKERFESLRDKAKQISLERMRVKDRELEVTAVTWDQDDPEGNQRELKIWLSDEIPVGGMVRFWCSDPAFPATELVDYGYEGK